MDVGVQIELLAIRFDSTCISLSLPHTLCCEICLSRKDPLKLKRKKRKHDNIRHTNHRFFCKQFWDKKWLIGTRATDSIVLLHYNIE